MIKKNVLSLLASLGFAFGMTCIAQAAAPAWEEIALRAEGIVDGFGHLVDKAGNVQVDAKGKLLVPSCALDSDFKFFVQEGDPSKILLFHDGGGACWEGDTCASSIFLGNDGTYYPDITATAESLPYRRGVLAQESANPFYGWTKVFIPYCTGDIGWGNRDTDYVSQQIVPGYQFTIRHRGYANIRAVTRWLGDKYDGQPFPKKVAVAGISAGSYAASGVVFPEVLKVFPNKTTKTFVISDSGNGVMTDDFLDTAKVNWGTDATLPTYLQSVLDGDAITLIDRFYGTLTRKFPATRFGQFQNAYDLVQTKFFNIMKNVNDPLLWNNTDAITQSLGEWTIRARVSTLVNAKAPNYRFYTAQGIEHTVLSDVPPEANAGFCSDDMYAEHSAGGLNFTSWLSDMLNRNGILWFTGNWRNATCFPNCLPTSNSTREGCPVLQQ